MSRRRRLKQYLIQYTETEDVNEKYKTCTVAVASLDQINRRMETDHPDARVRTVYRLTHVWGEG